LIAIASASSVFVHTRFDAGDVDHRRAARACTTRAPPPANAVPVDEIDEVGPSVALREDAERVAAATTTFLCWATGFDVVVCGGGIMNGALLLSASEPTAPTKCDDAGLASDNECVALNEKRLASASAPPSSISFRFRLPLLGSTVVAVSAREFAMVADGC